MSDPIETEEIEDAGAPTGEVLEAGGEAEEITAPRQDEPTSTLAIVMAVEQAELRVTKLTAIAEEKREALASINSSLGETQAILGRLDKLESLTLEDVHCLENTRRKARRLESERVAALSNLEAAGADLAEAQSELDAAELAESEDRLKRLSDSVGSTVLVFVAHLRALCSEVLEAGREVEASAPFGHKFVTPPAFPFKSLQSPNLPERPGAGYPASEAIEIERFLKWLIDVVRLTGGNGPLDERAYWHRWAAADPILPTREEPADGRPN